MADVDLQVADAPLADTDDLYDSETEEIEEPSGTSSFAKISSPVEAKTVLNATMEEDDDEEWNAFHSHEPSGNLDETEGSRGETLNGGGGCAESVLGSVSSGYSSLAGTCDNLMQHARGGLGSSSSTAKTPSEAIPSVGAFTTSQSFSEAGSHSGSLEDLVGTFDEKITACFGDLRSDVSEIAPVRTQEEILSQNTLYQDINASFGTVLPIDWSKTLIRNKLFLPVLGLRDGEDGKKNRRKLAEKNAEKIGSQSEEDDEELHLVTQLDMHSIVVADHDQEIPHSRNPNVNRLATAEEVIKEIETMMQGNGPEDGSDLSDSTKSDAHGDGGEIGDGPESPPLPALPSPLYEEKLSELSSVELLELQTELERLTQRYSEILVFELAARDELQFEKEVKNSFISELIRVQNKRRQMAGERKKRHSGASLNPNDLRNSGQQGKYLNTIIPYEPGVSTRHMQALIKILQAINEDSPTTPTLLTDYILKVLCPKD